MLKEYFLYELCDGEQYLHTTQCSYKFNDGADFLP